MKMNRTFGIDVSRWQGDFAFGRAAAEGAKFAVLRGAYTAPALGGGKDAKFEEYYKRAKAAGLAVGVYQYSMAQTPAQAIEEARFLHESCLSGKQFDVPVYFDIEDAVHKKLGRRLATDIVKAWCGYLEERGYFAGVYSFKAFFDGYLFDSELKHYTHWVAQWADSCTYQPSEILGMWQFGGETNTLRTNKVAGVTCDQNYMLRDFPSIIKAGGYNGYKKQSSDGAARLRRGADGYYKGFNVGRGENDLCVYVKPLKKAPTNKYGWEAAVNRYKVVTDGPEYWKGGMKIPEGGRVISGHGTAGDFVKKLRPGYLVWIENGRVYFSTYQHRGVDKVNGSRGKDCLCVYDRGKNTGTNKWGAEVQIIGAAAAAAPVYGKGSMAIPSGGYVLSGHGEAAWWMMQYISKGTKVTFDGDIITLE